MNYILLYLQKDLSNIVKEYLKYSLEDRSNYIHNLIYNVVVDSLHDIKCQHLMIYNYKNKRLDLEVINNGIFRYYTLYNKDEDEIRKWIIKYDTLNTYKLNDLDIKNDLNFI